MPRETIVMGKSAESAGKSMANPKTTNYQLVPAAAKDLQPVMNAAEKLREGITQRFVSPDYVTLAMHVNVQTARADLIPIPHAENLRKLKDNFDRLPTKVQDVIRKNIPQEQMNAVEEIYEYLERNSSSDREHGIGQETKAIEQKESQY